MRAGTRFDEEDYDDPDSDGRLIEQISGYTTRFRSDLPANTYEWIGQLDNAEPTTVARSSTARSSPTCWPG